jgi:hypothetical protein
VMHTFFEKIERRAGDKSVCEVTKALHT